MSVHVVLNLLNKMGKRDKMRGLHSILSLFPNFFNKFNVKHRSTNVSLYLSYVIKVTLKWALWCENIKILSLCMQCFYGLPYIALQNL